MRKALPQKVVDENQQIVTAEYLRDFDEFGVYQEQVDAAIADVKQMLHRMAGGVEYTLEPRLTVRDEKIKILITTQRPEFEHEVYHRLMVAKCENIIAEYDELLPAVKDMRKIVKKHGAPSKRFIVTLEELEAKLLRLIDGEFLRKKDKRQGRAFIIGGKERRIILRDCELLDALRWLIV